MKNKENILKKEIDVNIDLANLSVSSVPTIIFICIFAFAFSVSVLGQFFLNNGENLATWISNSSSLSLTLSYLDFDFLITLLAGTLITVFNFSFLLNKNHARAVLLQPKKRSKLFNEKVTYPLIALASIVVVVKIIALLINLKYLSLDFNGVMVFIGDVLVSLTTLFWGFMCGTVATILPKRKIEAILGGVSLVLLPYSVIAITNFSATAFLHGYIFDDFYNLINLSILDPIREFYAYVNLGHYFAPFQIPVNRLLHSVLWIMLSVIGLLLIKKHFEKNYKFENCGKINNSKLITLASGISLPVIASYYITEFLYENFNPTANIVNVNMRFRYNSTFVNLPPQDSYILLVVFFALAIILSVLLNIISTQKILNIKEKIKPIFAITGALILTSVLCLSGGLGYEKDLPEVEEIKEISISTPYDLVENNYEVTGISDYFDIHNTVLREFVSFEEIEDFEKILKIHSSLIEDKNSETTEGIKFTYYLKDGSIYERTYECISKNNAEEILKLWDTTEVKNLYKAMLLNERDDNNELGYTLWSSTIISMDGFVYAVSKDATYSSITDVLSEKEIKELKETIYKDISSLTYNEWFKPTESYGLLQFRTKEMANTEPGFIISNEAVSFQITKEMKYTVEFLKSHDLMKFFDTTKQPVKAFLVDANDMSNYYYEYIKENYSSDYRRDYYPMQHRMMFTPETSASKQFYLKGYEPIFDTSADWITELTPEEYNEYIKKAHIKYFSGEGGKILIVAYPESHSGQSLIIQ